DLIRELGEIYELHPLLLEDVVNTAQRPKLEEFDNCQFIAMKMLHYNEKEEMVQAEQLSIVIGQDFVVTFQERPGDVFEPVRERIRKYKGRIRSVGNDYLAYALIDTVIDNYIYLIEHIGVKIEDLEEKILENPKPEILQQINTFKQEISFLGKVIRPVRELVSRLARTESDLLHRKTMPFIKDLYDLITHSTETIDTYREILSDYLNIYHTGLSNRINEVMKVLTIFAAIFIPLTFIAGIYGTNFDYIPELGFRYAYFIMWGVIVIVAIIMLLYFKRKKWF
ncbi:MAG: magnesium/cobalt transporter CorA, partial [Bacteroidales bacterium]